MGQPFKGVVERLTEKGFVCAGTWLGYSKFFKETRFTEADLGRTVELEVHEYKDRLYVDRLVALGEKDPNFVPRGRSESGAGPGGNFGRRPLGPEEMALKKDEARRIAASVGVQWGFQMALHGKSWEDVKAHAAAVAEFILGFGASAAPSSKVESRDPAPDARPWRSANHPQARMTLLYDAAHRAGVVADWPNWVKGLNQILGEAVASPLDLSDDAFARVADAVEILIENQSKAGRQAA